jgi:hypothetical protein
MQLTKPRSGSFDVSFTPILHRQRSPYIHRHGRSHGPRPVHSASTLSGRHASRSNLSSYAHSTRSRRYPSSQQPRPFRDFASPSPSLFTHRSLATLGSNTDVHSVRSASPMGPTRRFHRPYRGSSPGLVDDRSEDAPHPGSMRAPSVGTVASSPRSIYPRRGPFQGYRPDLNGSNASLDRMPHPAYASPSRKPYPGTPASSLRATGPLSGSATSLAGILQSPSGSNTPAYYDYSESFTEEQGLEQTEGGNANVSQPTMAQIIHEDVPMSYHRHAQTPFGIKDGSRFHPIELPTRHNRRPSEQSLTGSKPNSQHSAKRSLVYGSAQHQANLDRPVTSDRASRLVRSSLRWHDHD